jgi:hypothetical protein
MEKHIHKAAFIYFSGWQKAFACYPTLLPNALTIFSLFNLSALYELMYFLVTPKRPLRISLQLSQYS